jgi:hypothetical protein
MYVLTANITNTSPNVPQKVRIMQKSYCFSSIIWSDLIKKQADQCAKGASEVGLQKLLLLMLMSAAAALTADTSLRWNEQIHLINKSGDSIAHCSFVVRELT